MAGKILFIKLGNFSLINEGIFGILKNEFENDEIEVLDVMHFLKKKSWLYKYFINVFYSINEYGRDIILGYKKPNDLYLCFLGTSYISLQINKAIRKYAEGKNYKFTFQTQTLFNGKLTGIPHFIYTDHTTKANLLYPDINPKNYQRSERFINKVENKIYQDADMIFTCGSLTTRSLVTQYHIPQEKVLTVFAGSALKEHFVENNEKYASKNILFVGVDWERKGGPILVKAFEKVLEKHSDASLTIIGCSPANVSVANCNILGKLPQVELARYYNNAAVFCLPTLREPFGIVFIEAMLYKLPVVANNIGSIPDMVTNDFNGYLIDNNIEGYAEAICKLFDDPQKARTFGENGFNLANSKFTWNSVGKTMTAQMLKFL